MDWEKWLNTNSYDEVLRETRNWILDYLNLWIEMYDYKSSAYDEKWFLKPERLYIVKLTPEQESKWFQRDSIYPPNILKKFEEISVRLVVIWNKIKSLEWPDKNKLYQSIMKIHSKSLNTIWTEFKNHLFWCLWLDYLDFSSNIINEAREAINKAMQTPKNPS